MSEISRSPMNAFYVSNIFSNDNFFFFFSEPVVEIDATYYLFLRVVYIAAHLQCAILQQNHVLAGSSCSQKFTRKLALN